MEIEKLKGYLKVLEPILQEFSEHEYFSGVRKKKADRDSEKRQMDFQIQAFRSYVERDEELYDYILLPNKTPMGKHFVYDELIQRRYFRRDLERIIERMKKDIEESNE